MITQVESSLEEQWKEVGREGVGPRSGKRWFIEGL